MFSWFKKEDTNSREKYISDLKKLVARQYFRSASEAFKELRDAGCYYYQVLDNNDVEFYFKENEIVNNKQKITIRNQLIYTR